MTHNVAASVHQRLLNQARAQERPFDELLQYFALERFLYRLGRSPYAAKFVLEGALMFNVWQGAAARSTRDVTDIGNCYPVHCGVLAASCSGFGGNTGF